MSYLIQAAAVIINFAFGIYILMIMLRFLFQWVRADFYNPISQALVKLTNPPLIMLRRVIPGLWGIDLAAIVLMLLLQSLELFLAGDPASRVPGLIHGQLLNLAGLPVAALAALLNLAIWVFIIALLIQIIISWINPSAAYNNPVASLLFALTSPLMRPARRLMPPVSGIDFSPMVVLLGLYLAQILIVQPLQHLALSLL
ncbi:MAG: YggT family protein [Gammaproteobacteria bacterium]|nr:YggT family protein [Gammaproteobacteria bacterium]